MSQQPALVTGLIVSMLISFFSLFAAYADGRHIWTSYPFTIPMAVAYIKYFRERKILFPSGFLYDLEIFKQEEF